MRDHVYNTRTHERLNEIWNQKRNFFLQTDGGCRKKGFSATGWRLRVTNAQTNKAYTLAYGGTLHNSNLSSLHIEALALLEAVTYIDLQMLQAITANAITTTSDNDDSSDSSSNSSTSSSTSTNTSRCSSSNGDQDITTDITMHDKKTQHTHDARPNHTTKSGSSMDKPATVAASALANNPDMNYTIHRKEARTSGVVRAGMTTSHNTPTTHTTAERNNESPSKKHKLQQQTQQQHRKSTKRPHTDTNADDNNHNDNNHDGYSNDNDHDNKKHKALKLA